MWAGELETSPAQQALWLLQLLVVLSTILGVHLPPPWSPEAGGGQDTPLLPAPDISNALPGLPGSWPPVGDTRPPYLDSQLPSWKTFLSSWNTERATDPDRPDEAQFSKAEDDALPGRHVSPLQDLPHSHLPRDAWPSNSPFLVEVSFTLSAFTFE